MALISVSRTIAAVTIPFLLAVPWSAFAITPATTERNLQRRPQKLLRPSRSRDTHIRNRKLVRGQSWVEQHNRGPVIDNIFVRSTNTSSTTDECVCDELQRQNEIGCICESRYPTSAPTVNGKGSSYYGKGGKGKGSSYYGKGGKGSKGKGKGKGSSNYYQGEIVDDDFDDYYQGGSSNSYQKKSSKSSKKRKEKSSKSSFGKGFGKGYRYDDDYVYPTRAPSRVPSIPTVAPIEVPTANPPMSISPDIGREPSKAPTVKPKPPSPQPKPPLPQCSVSSDGLYGQKTGLATEFRFRYVTQLIPSVKQLELTTDILPKVEVAMGNKLLPSTFPADCSTLNQRRQGKGIDEQNRFFRNREIRRKQRQLQSPLSLNGLSIKPRDSVDESGVCDLPIPSTVFPCFVIDGAVTVFSTEKLDTSNRLQIENAIRNAIEENLNEADNRLLTVAFREFVESPPPSEPPIDGSSWFFDTAWWILMLIAMAVVFVLVVLLICITRMCRKRRQQRRLRPQANRTDLEKENGLGKNNNSNSSSSKVSISSSNSNSRSNSNSSIATNENLSFGNGAPTSEPPVLVKDNAASSGYHHHSNSHIDEALMPNIEEPIVEERQDDFSSGEFVRKPSSQAYDSSMLYMPNPDDTYNGNMGMSYTEVTVEDTDRYNGVSYEDQIYQNNQVTAYNPNSHRYSSDDAGDDLGSQPSKSDSFEQDVNDEDRPLAYDSNGAESARSRSLSRNDNEFRELQGGVPGSSQTPSTTPVSHYSSDIYSNTSRQMSTAVIDEGKSYDDSDEEEYEIEYASQSELQYEDGDEEMLHNSGAVYDDDEEWVDENDRLVSNNNSNSSSTPYSNNNSNTNSNSKSTFTSGGDTETDDENLTPLPYLAHNAQLQQQMQKTSFDSLRNKWEQNY